MRFTLVVCLLVMLGRLAAADDASAARTLFKRGVEEYKAKKYGEASITLLKSYELDPKPDTLFALAQAERLDNRCPDALEHYKKLLEQTTDLATAKAIGSNIELCAVAPKPPEVPIVVVKPVEPAKPQVITKTIVKTESRTDKLSVALFATGALALGGSAALFLASRNSNADSDGASTLEESNRLFDRSKRERLLAFATLGVGGALVTYGIVRIVRSRSATATEVAIAPTAGGAEFAIATRW